MVPVSGSFAPVVVGIEIASSEKELENQMLIGFNSRRGSRKSNRVAAEIQHLETRALLAGNVLATISDNGTVFIRGDNAANDVTIDVDGDVVTITGNNGTTINGQDVDDFDAVDLNNLRISLRGGADKLTVNVNDAPTDSIPGRVRISAGSGADVVCINTIAELTITKGLSINLGNGNDALSIQGEAGLSLANALRINGGSGNDTIGVVNVMQADAVGNDGDMIFRGGAGNDQFALSELTVSHNLTVESGVGDDQVAVSELAVAGNARITTGVGNDTLSAEGAISIDGNLRVSLGAGNDDLSVAEDIDLSVTGNARINGGPGKDNENTDEPTKRFENDDDPVADDFATIIERVNAFCMDGGDGE